MAVATDPPQSRWVGTYKPNRIKLWKIGQAQLNDVATRLRLDKLARNSILSQAIFEAVLENAKSKF